MLTRDQKAAVTYYEGDVHGDDPFWGDAKAYVTLNALFYPGIDTERRRAAEGKRLNPAIVAGAGPSGNGPLAGDEQLARDGWRSDADRLDSADDGLVGVDQGPDVDPLDGASRHSGVDQLIGVDQHSGQDRLFGVCTNLLQACMAGDLSKPCVAYRVERHADYLDMRAAGHTISFTSTSTGGFLPAYGDRIGIALLEFRIPAGVPRLDLAEELGGDYAKSDEQEILLPPDLPLSFEEVPLGPGEEAITDAEDKPPIVKCLVSVGPTNSFTAIEDTAFPASDAMCAPDATAHVMMSPYSPPGQAAAARVYSALNAGEEPAPEDVELYLAWKAAFRREVIDGARRTS